MFKFIAHLLHAPRASGLRRGLLVQRKALSAKALDELASIAHERAGEGVLKVLGIIRTRARLVVDAGLEGTLTIDELSEFEMRALAAARSEIDRRNRTAFIALLVGGDRATVILPDDDPETVLAKKVAAAEAASWEMLGV